MTEILTPRLKLRRARPDDLEALHAVFTQPAAMRYWSTPPHAEQRAHDLAATVTPGPDSENPLVIACNALANISLIAANTWGSDQDRDEALGLDPSTASLLMFGGDETEHDLAEHPDAEELP